MDYQFKISKMKKLFSVSLILLLSVSNYLIAQNTGDTIVVETFNYGQTYGSGIRDTIIDFPDNSSLTFEKILMKYNIRCKDGNISPGISGQTNIGCGEWDYSCNTYIHDSSAVDSITSYTSSHLITGYSGNTYSYTTQPTYSVTQYIQPNMVINDIVNEVQSTVGNASIQVSGVFLTIGEASKSQFLYTAAELSAAGITPGEIAGIILNAYNLQEINFTRIKLKFTSDTILAPWNPDFSDWTEVYNHNFTTALNQNRFQFYQPFSWDGLSNIKVEFTYTNDSLGNFLALDGHPTPNTKGIHSWSDKYPIFNGSNYIETNSYKGIGGNDPRTIEAWIKTSVPNKEIVSWGRNATTEKWVFRINDTGELRVEVNGGYQIGTTVLTDNQWHHVACVYDGTNVTDVKLYVDGILESISNSSGSTVNTDIINGINVRISRGVNDRYFNGIIDEVRIWSAALPQNIIEKYMYEYTENGHPFYYNLELDYEFSEMPGINIVDNSSNFNTATIINGEIRGMFRGKDIFKNFHSFNYRPDITFLQGTYSQTLQNDTVNDTLTSLPNTVNVYAIQSNTNTIYSDEISLENSFIAWEATYNYVYDEQGNIIDSIAVTPDGIINISQLPYYQRWPAKYEIMSFVTPYGINLDLGMEGKTWTFDVSDYMPVLKGQKRMTVERGGQWQEDMNIKFLFIVGTPSRDVLDIKQIWRCESRTYTDILSEKYFAPRNIYMLPYASSFKIRTAISGHGQEGEFIPQQHFLNINGGSNEFTWTVWKECAENPVYPQGGTWIYNRAGWCPGMATDTKHYDITQYVTPGDSALIDYGVTTAQGTSKYIVSSQLLSYGSANHLLDASITEIIQPSNRIEFARINSICNNPKIKIQNSGSALLTSVIIKYWVNNASSKEEYEWNGSLEFMESEDVILPSTENLWSNVTPQNNVFYAEIVSPNGGSDEYTYNNLYRSEFDIPEVMPSEVVLMFMTNNAPSESSYEVIDSEGNIIVSRNNMTANTLYYDTLILPIGCYKYKVYDTGDDGIDFWNNSDGTGYTRFKAVGGSIVKYFEGDFGDNIEYNFTVDFPLSYEDIQHFEKINVYPNPASDIINISIEGFDGISELEILNYSGQIVYRTNIQSDNNKVTLETDIRSLTSGLYLVRITNGNKVMDTKFVKHIGW